MSIFTFLDQLMTTGDLRIDPKPPSTRKTDHDHDDLQKSHRVLRTCEDIRRMSMPLDPPAFHIETAIQAALLLEQFCRAVVCRETELADVRTILDACRSLTNSPEAHYSVDLTLQFLPQVFERAARVSTSDPLLDLLKVAAEQWPLSSVGVPGCSVDKVPEAIHHPSLWRLYIDRIIARNDSSRLSVATVRTAVESAISLFPDLSPISKSPALSNQTQSGSV